MPLSQAETDALVALAKAAAGDIGSIGTLAREQLNRITRLAAAAGPLENGVRGNIRTVLQNLLTLPNNPVTDADLLEMAKERNPKFTPDPQNPKTRAELIETIVLGPVGQS